MLNFGWLLLSIAEVGANMHLFLFPICEKPNEITDGTGIYERLPFIK
ncbi:hypothetical protein [Tumebacillus flagellatus]|nr:hypothetical protein [Tumebacillus flagellatus]